MTAPKDNNHTVMHTKGSPAYEPITLAELRRRIADGQTGVYFNGRRVTGISSPNDEPEDAAPVTLQPICILAGTTQPGVRVMSAAEARAEGHHVDDTPPLLVPVQVPVKP